ncbi:hypothetical protein [Microbulbifer sp.]|uniref:hypothetical protein n=1 Tax=Microbulbifer sp. TaxID=1908541 RepID=UPI0025865EF2|nr:hypothetical protein [Microbulbifer sp.]
MASLTAAFKFLILILLATLLSACSGGSNNSTPEADPPQEEQPEEDPGNGSGEDPGDEPEEDPGKVPDENPGEDPGEEPTPAPEEEADTTPDTFAFEPSENTSVDVLVYSNIVEISGINQPVEVGIEGGQYSIEGSEFTTDTGFIENGDTIQVRHQSAESNSVTTETNLTIGGISASFTSNTGAYTGQLAIASDGLDLILLGLDPDGQIYERSRASLPSLDGYNENHQILSVTEHPSKDMLFVSSANECETISLGFEFNCAGNARIDRFTYDQNTLNYDGLAYLAQPPLRLSAPDIESTDTYKAVSFSVTNQSESPIEIADIVLEHADDTELTTDCIDNPVNSNESCTVTLQDGGEYMTPRGIIQIDTSVGQFNTFIAYILYEYDGKRLGYFVPSLMSEDEMGVPLCALHGYYADGIEWSESAVIIDSPNLIDFGGKDNKAGACLLSSMTFNAEGDRAYATDFFSGSIMTFDVSETGALTFVNEDVENPIDYLTGLAINSEETILYSGANTYTVRDNTLQPSENNDYDLAGHATELVTGENYESLLISITDLSQLGVYQLDTDPLAPAQIALVQSENVLADQAHSEDLRVFTVIEQAGDPDNDENPRIIAYNFDGETFSPADSKSIDLSFDACESCQQSYDYTVHPNTIKMNSEGSRAYSSAYINAYDDYTREEAPWLGAILSYDIDTDTGEILEQARLPLNGNSRALILVDIPASNKQQAK